MERGNKAEKLLDTLGGRWSRLVNLCKQMLPKDPKERIVAVMGKEELEKEVESAGSVCVGSG